MTPTSLRFATVRLPSRAVSQSWMAVGPPKARTIVYVRPLRVVGAGAWSVTWVAESRWRMKSCSAGKPVKVRRSPTPTLAGRLAPPANVTVREPAVTEPVPVP
jgi:hypothetical protein